VKAISLSIVSLAVPSPRLSGLDRFEGRSRFSSWLTRIAVNAALIRLRVSRREPAISLDNVSETGKTLARIHPMETRPNPEEEYLSKEGRVLLQKALNKLSPLYVEVLHLLGTQELSAKEAAGHLRVPVGTVKARLHRARAKLTRHVRSITSRKGQLGMSSCHHAMRRYGSIPSSDGFSFDVLA